MSIQFVQTDAKTIADEMITAYESYLGETLYPGDERRIFLLSFLQWLVSAKNSINQTGLQNLLRYATGDYLDAIGELYGSRGARLKEQKAITTARFTLSAVQLNNVIIPSGTRITPDGILYFATKSELVIIANETHGDIMVEATAAGTRYNGFTAGQIKYIVDPVAFVASVANLDTSISGTDAESDSSYRERIRIAPESFSVAGSEGAYQYFAVSADSAIVDVNVYTPKTVKIFNQAKFALDYPSADPTLYYTVTSGGQVNINVLLENGEIPNSTISDKVYAACNSFSVRPLTDYVVMEAPTQTTYNVDFTWYITKDQEPQLSQIASAINLGVQNYNAWQVTKLGRDINPDQLRKNVLSAGAYVVAVTSPSYVALDSSHVAKLGTVSVTYGGIKE